MRNVSQKDASQARNAESSSSATRGREPFGAVVRGRESAASSSIQKRAFQIYQTRQSNGVAGDATSDWLQAERELIGSSGEPSAALGIDIKARARRGQQFARNK